MKRKLILSELLSLNKLKRIPSEISSFIPLSCHLFNLHVRYFANYVYIPASNFIFRPNISSPSYRYFNHFFKTVPPKLRSPDEIFI